MNNRTEYLKKHETIIGTIVGVYAIIAFTLTAYIGHSTNFNLLAYLHAAAELSVLLVVILVFCQIIYTSVVIRPKRPILTIVERLKNYITHPGQIRKIIFFVFILTILIQTVLLMKILLPTISPFVWDDYFAKVDSFVHFGKDPWMYTHWLFPFAWQSLSLNFLYNFWFFVMFGFLFWQILSRKNERVNMQFMYTFTLSWIINGTIFAYIFSSAGPCFYLDIFDKDKFTPLMDILNMQNNIFPMWALDVQEKLLDCYVDGDCLLVGNGISAMPSMHLSMATLFCLVSFKYNKILGFVFLAYLASIEVGSVHLGWHYAIDGYFSIATTSLIWIIAGRISKLFTLDTKLPTE